MIYDGLEVTALRAFHHVKEESEANRYRQYLCYAKSCLPRDAETSACQIFNVGGPRIALSLFSLFQLDQVNVAVAAAGAGEEDVFVVGREAWVRMPVLF